MLGRLNGSTLSEIGQDRAGFKRSRFDKLYSRMAAGGGVITRPVNRSRANLVCGRRRNYRETFAAVVNSHRASGYGDTGHLQAALVQHGNQAAAKYPYLDRIHNSAVALVGKDEL